PDCRCLLLQGWRWALTRGITHRHGEGDTSMKRIAIGAVTGLAVWFGSALAAEAQQITPTGPMKITSTDQSVTYSATITTNYSFWAYLTIFNNGVQVATWQAHVIQGGPSYMLQPPAFSTSTWGLAVADVIDFHLRIAVTPSFGYISDYNVTVQAPGTGPSSKSMMPRPEAEGMMAKAAAAAKQEGEDRVALKQESLA